MRRFLVVPVAIGLVAAISGLPQAAALPDRPTTGHVAEIVRLRADFNNDGAEDLAIGVPFEAVGAEQGAGAVNVVYGSTTGLTGAGSQLFTQDTGGVGSTAEAGDNFGWALAAGDFNNDGFTDLAVGAPGESVGNIISAGAVNVLYGSASGLSGAGSQLVIFNDLGVDRSSTEGDRLGAALAAGDFNSDGTEDLAIAAPTARLGSSFGAGQVVVVDGSSGGLVIGNNTHVLFQGIPGVGSNVEPSDFFGEALAAGDFNGNGVTDLAIGVPGESVGTLDAAGAVNIVFGRTGGPTGASSQLLTQNTPGVGSTAEPFDNFGDALAAGDYNDSGVTDLAIGAPGETVGTLDRAGAVNVLFGRAGGLTGTSSQLITQDTPGVGSTAEPFDNFGRPLEAGDFNGNGVADLAIGAPFEQVGTANQAGAVNVLFGRAGGLTGTSSQLITQDTPGVGSTAEPGDDFGGALGAGDFNGNGTDELAIGVPFEAVGAIEAAGAVNVLIGQIGGLTGTGSLLLTQDTPGIGSTVEPGDGFGFALETSPN
jgi:hypothetical protein